MTQKADGKSEVLEMSICSLVTHDFYLMFFNLNATQKVFSSTVFTEREGCIVE